MSSWFATWATDPVIYEYMSENFKTNPVVKEECRAYMKSKMAELSPLPFECPITHAKHHIPWPKYWVFDVIKRRKHEFRKQDKKTGISLFHFSYQIFHSEATSFETVHGSCPWFKVHSPWFMVAENIPQKRIKNLPQQSELEKEVRPDDDEAEAMDWMSKSNTFLLNLFASVRT